MVIGWHVSGTQRSWLKNDPELEQSIQRENKWNFMQFRPVYPRVPILSCVVIKHLQSGDMILSVMPIKCHNTKRLEVHLTDPAN